MSFEFQSTLINLTPEFRISGEQVGGVRLFTASGGIKVARVIITGDKDIQFAAMGKPYEAGDPDAIYAALQPNLAEIVEDELLLNPSAISSVKYTAEEIIINVEGDNRAWRFVPSADPEAPNSKEIADHTYELSVVRFALLTTAAGTFRESVDGTLEGLNTAILTEVSNRTAAVAALQADVDQNEADVDAAVAAEAAARDAADQTIIASVANEASTREAADTTLQANIDAEAATRASADTTEANTRSGADAALSARLDTLEADPTTATAVAAGDAATLSSANTYTDTSITNLVNGADAALDTLKEIGDALAQGDSDVTAALTAQITTEATTRAAADTALSGRLDTLEADPTTATAVAAVQADVDQNESDSDAADAALSARLDVLEADPTTATALAAVQSDVDTNEADSDAADAALSGRLDVLEADPTTATAVAAVQADVDQNESDSDAADAALSARLDVLEADPTTATAVAANTSDIADIRSVTGTLDGSTHLGNFSGAIITDGIAIKTALQELSNAIEATQTDVDGNEADADAADALRPLLDGSNIPGTYNNDTEAGAGGVPVGGIYKNSNGTIHWRVS